MWKDFFYFTKTERQGIIVLVVLILGTFAIPKLFTLFIHPKEMDAAEQEKLEKSIMSLSLPSKRQSHIGNLPATPFAHLQKRDKACRLRPEHSRFHGFSVSRVTVMDG